MQEAAGDDTKLVRVMPNTPCLVGETASAMCLGGTASDEDAEEVRTLFSSVGRIVQVGDILAAGQSAHPSYICLASLGLQMYSLKREGLLDVIR